MSLTRRSIETLLDLVENKLSCMQVIDREDARELATLENARRELAVLGGGRRTAQVLPFVPAVPHETSAAV
ncbi:MAG: hypothetical protein ACT4P2_08335 [Pseudomonadota bacterium]